MKLAGSRGRRERDAARIGGSAARDDDSRGWLDPFAGIGETDIGADGANQRSGSDFDFVGTFENVFEHETDVLAALGVEAGGLGVAIEGGPIPELMRTLTLSVVGKYSISSFRYSQT